VPLIGDKHLQCIECRNVNAQKTDTCLCVRINQQVEISSRVAKNKRVFRLVVCYGFLQISAKRTWHQRRKNNNSNKRKERNIERKKKASTQKERKKRKMRERKRKKREKEKGEEKEEAREEEQGERTTHIHTYTHTYRHKPSQLSPMAIAETSNEYISE
jgi:hypothetical protein